MFVYWDSLFVLVVICSFYLLKLNLIPPFLLPILTIIDNYVSFGVGMSNYIAIVQAVLGVVKAVSDTKGERLLQPGDLIYDDDVLITSNLTGAKVSTSEGFNIDLSLGEQWQFNEGGFVDATNGRRVDSAEIASELPASIEFETQKEQEQATEEDGGFNSAYRVNSDSANRVLRTGAEVTPQVFSNRYQNSITGREQEDFGVISLGVGNYSFYQDDFLGFKKAFYALLAGGRNPTLSELRNIDVQRIDTDNINAVQGNIRRNVKDGVDIDSLDKLQGIADTAIEILNRIVLAAINNDASDAVLNLDQFDRIGITAINAGNLQQVFSVLNKNNVVGIDVNTTPKIQKLVAAYNKVLALADGVDNDDSILSVDDFYVLGLRQIDEPVSAQFISDVLDLKTRGDVNQIDQIESIIDNYQMIMAAADGIANGGYPTLENFQAINLSAIDSTAKAHVLSEIIDVKVEQDIDTYSELESLSAIVAKIFSAAQHNTEAPTKEEFAKIGIIGVNSDNEAIVQRAIQATLDDGSQVDTLAQIQALINSSVYIVLNFDSGQLDSDLITFDLQVNVFNVDSSAAWQYSIDSGVSWQLGSNDSFLLAENTVYSLDDIQVKATNSAGNLSTATLLALTTDNISDDVALSLDLDTGAASSDLITSATKINVTGLEPGSNWAYTLDNGASWVDGQGSFFNLADNTTYSADHIQVQSSDVAGNTYLVKMSEVITDVLADQISL